MKKILFWSLFSLTLVSCSTEESFVEPIAVQPKILVIGNSITKCQPGGEWTGSWGMAATAPDKDFCGLVEKSMNAELLDKKNIAIWENNFYCSEEHYTITTSIQYDYIIIKIGENVSDLVNFKEELVKLVAYYKHYGNKVALVSTVWAQYEFDSMGNPYEVPSDKDRIIKEVALENNYEFVDISEMKVVSSNYAWGQYVDGGIGSHPSDQGMQFIANKILEKIKFQSR